MIGLKRKIVYITGDEETFDTEIAALEHMLDTQNFSTMELFSEYVCKKRLIRLETLISNLVSDAIEVYAFRIDTPTKLQILKWYCEEREGKIFGELEVGKRYILARNYEESSVSIIPYDYCLQVE